MKSALYFNRNLDVKPLLQLLCLQSTEKFFLFTPNTSNRVFNFLFYEKQWGFDRLYDMLLLFQPGIELADYCVQYELWSRKFENKLRLMLPYQFEHPSIHSLRHLFANAGALEKKLTDIHQMQFKQRTSRIS